MANENKALEVQKQEMIPAEGAERTRECRCFVPRSDIYETENAVVVTMDLPGVEQNSIDITIEKNILTVNGYTAVESPEGYTLIFAEYEVGDFERSFRLSEEIDREKIDATIKDGVLILTLPKLDAAKSRKVKVKSG